MPEPVLLGVEEEQIQHKRKLGDLEGSSGDTSSLDSRGEGDGEDGKWPWSGEKGSAIPR